MRYKEENHQRRRGKPVASVTKTAVTTLTATMLVAGICSPAMSAPIGGVDQSSPQSSQGDVSSEGVEKLSQSLLDEAKKGASDSNLEQKTGGKVIEKTDRFIVTYKNGTDHQDKQESVKEADSKTPLDNGSIDRERADGTTVIKNDKDLSKSEQSTVMKELEKDPSVKSVEPDYVVENGEASYPTRPNDPYFAGYQWNLRNIDVPGAWQYATGKGVTIGIADTGLTYHPDLASKWTPGYDFVSDAWYGEDGGGRDPNPQDEGDQVRGNGVNAWHGSHVSGIAGAVTNNGIGVAGVAPDAKMTMARNMGRGGRGYISDYADSIMWLAGVHIPGVPDNKYPSKVVNLSEAWDSAQCPSVMKRAIDVNHARNVPVVVAAGNTGVNANGVSPANCLGAIVVGATASSNWMTGYSNWGPMLDVVAPGGAVGGDIWSTVNSGAYSLGVPTYAALNGTSMAAPHVAGIIAMMKERNPDLKVEEIRSILQRTGTNTGGYKLVNAKNAVSAVNRKINVQGAIAGYYNSHGGAGKFGTPTNNEFKSVDGGCVQNFSKGYAIYWHPKAGAHSERWGTGISNTFARNGYERGWGYPNSDEQSTWGGHAYYKFYTKPWEGRKPVAFWSPSTGTHMIDQTWGIGSKWAQRGREWGLGIPTSDESSAGNGIMWQGFKSRNGGQSTIIWKSGIGAHVINENGAIASKWNTRNRERGLGVPTSDESNAGNGIMWQSFQSNNGGKSTVIWTSKSGAHIINENGAIAAEWNRHGREKGKYGYPVTDEYSQNGGMRQKFSNGWTIEWKNGRINTFKG